MSSAPPPTLPSGRKIRRLFFILLYFFPQAAPDRLFLLFCFFWGGGLGFSSLCFLPLGMPRPSLCVCFFVPDFELSLSGFSVLLIYGPPEVDEGMAARRARG